MSKGRQITLYGFLEQETQDYLPHPYIDLGDGRVNYACWYTRQCPWRRHRGDSLTCAYYTADADKHGCTYAANKHGCTRKEARRLTLQRHIQAFQAALQELEAER